MSTTDFTSAIRDAVARAVAVIGLCGIALIHLLDSPGKFAETPYMGWMYVGLMASCVVVAGALVATSDTRAWLAAAALPVLVLLGYILSRTTGLPQAHGDVGNWGEPLGMASLFVEGSLLALSAAVLTGRGALSVAPVRRALVRA